MQPSHVKWEQLIPQPTQPADQHLTNGHLTNGHLTNGDSMNALTNGDTLTAEHTHLSDNFSPVSDVIARNFLVTDTYFENPPLPNMGVPGPDGDVEDLGPNGLSTVSQDLLEELPEECRAAFEEAQEAELGWKRKWGHEQRDGARGKLRIGFNGFPV